MGTPRARRPTDGDETGISHNRRSLVPTFRGSEWDAVLRHRPDDDFDEVFTALLPRAKAVAYRILGDTSDAEDAAVEAFARAAVRWRRVGGMPPPARDAWVLRVTSNVAYDELRRRIRRRRPAPVQPVPDGSKPLDDIDLRDVVVANLARLPRRQREVLTLRYIGGFNEAEIAASLGVTAGTVKTSASRGLGTLRTNLGSQADFSAPGSAAEHA